MESMKHLMTSILILFSLNAASEEVGTQHIQEIMIVIGVPQKFERSVQHEFSLLRNRYPDSLEEIMCMEEKTNFETIVDFITPLYKEVFPSEFFVEFHSLLNTKTGKKIADLIKKGPPFTNAKRHFTDEESEVFEQFYRRFNHYLTPEVGKRLESGTQRYGLKFFTDLANECELKALTI
ncbi:MAG: hypothetical protein JXR18_02145 [Neptuniibacter sp.]